MVYSLNRILVSGIIFVCLDAIYLLAIKNWFSKQIQMVQGIPIKFNIIGALLCYIILIAGINYFIIIERKSIMDAFLLGLFVYGVYETTNYALFTKWSIFTVILDTLWGGSLFALTTYFMSLIK